MEIVSTTAVIITLFGFSYLLLKPKKQPKSKAQKQEEIRQNYQKRLMAELLHVENPIERQNKKISLLKEFAKELEFNLFFDENEVKALIKELAGY
ncbi:MAG: hypothetical protein PHN38_04915 [Sulfurospirillaceae bacterium]|nr:hypothetical protein [Sulfurospirillaceae bacterium]MDD3462715.1 hypothetical protein [Sulfurospirillaceae bacterium]